MGNLVAAGYAEAVADGDVDLAPAVSANLRGNHFPPLPHEYVPLTVEAIKACADDDYEALVTIPADLDPKPRAAFWDEDTETLVVHAHTLVEITHSWAFVHALTANPTED